jgi:hypothetical protein
MSSEIDLYDGNQKWVLRSINLVTIAIMCMYIWRNTRGSGPAPYICIFVLFCLPVLWRLMTSKSILSLHQSACSVGEVIFEFPARIFVARDMILCWKKSNHLTTHNGKDSFLFYSILFHSCIRLYGILRFDRWNFFDRVAGRASVSSIL